MNIKVLIIKLNTYHLQKWWLMYKDISSKTEHPCVKINVIEGRTESRTQLVRTLKSHYWDV